MKRRVIILTEIISPYRIPLFNALARQPQVDLHVIFLAETDPSLRQWLVYKDEIKFSYEVLPSWRKRIGRYNMLINSGVARSLKAAVPEVIICGGYNYVASWQTLMWTGTHHVPIFLWSESNRQDQRRGHVLVELLKSQFLKKCDGFIVPGCSAREYLRSHKVKDNRIFTARNAVDNDLFAELAAKARQDASARRRDLNLPDRYFLFVGRLVREKGVFDLLSAYAGLDEDVRHNFGLVFAGDGVCRQELEQRAKSIVPGTVIFSGFAQRDDLAAYYALASALILPTYTDPWGLVVNEAMACGLPVIVSDVAGCAADLVKDGWNGFSVPPRDANALSRAMAKMVVDATTLAAMGSNSRELIAEYSPEKWAISIAEAVMQSRAKA